MLEKDSATGRDGSAGVILPDAIGAVGEFWRGAAEGKLLLQRCAKCRHIWHPPMDVCPRCQSFDIEWTATPGLGVLYSFTRVEHAVHQVVAAWIPYTLCVVELDEGPRVLTLFDDRSGEPRIGKPVRLSFKAMPEGFQLPVFSAAGAA